MWADCLPWAAPLARSPPLPTSLSSHRTQAIPGWAAALLLLLEDWRQCLMALAIAHPENWSHQSSSVHATHEHPGPWGGKEHARPALQPRTSVFKWAPPHPVYHAGKCSSWQTCSLSVPIFHSLWSPGNLPALSYLSHISVIIFVRKRQIASDGWGELWQSRTGWVRAKECGRVWSRMDREVCLLCSTLILFREMHRKEGP